MPGIDTLNERQSELVGCPVDGRIFVEGPAGTGKTTAGVARMVRLLEEGIPAQEMLVIVPQRTLASPYLDALCHPDLKASAQVTVLTFGGLARRMVDLLWPLVVEEVGFGHPERPPVFLTLETAQYYMARLVRPLLDEGYFESVRIDRNRLYSQIIDNLNKSAIVGFPHTSIGERLKSAWGGEQSQQRIYDEAQECALRFRRYCLDNNLLDFSLQFEIFNRHLWSMSLCRGYLLENYTHLIVDNIEEDTPVVHDILKDWTASCRSALLIYDSGGGYRRFLGADPVGAYGLKEGCEKQFEFDSSFVASPDVEYLGEQLSSAIDQQPLALPEGAKLPLTYQYQRYYPEMLDWVVEEISALLGEGVLPGDIAVLVPFLTDSLRFSLMNRLEERGIPVRSHRPSRALRDEPATRCLLTLAALAHPEWGFLPTKFDVAHALMQAIEGMDLVRAQLMAEIVYRMRDGQPALFPFDQIEPKMQSRLTFVLGERYDRLRFWLERYSQEPVAQMDHFLGRLFGEVLSQFGYGFHHNYDDGGVAANLVESVRKFRWVAEDMSIDSVGSEYVEMVRDGVVAAQYVRSWRLQPEDAILLAPAYTFIMSNRAVGYQFWLDVGSRGWWERLNQPLTHPYVLSRQWELGQIWSDADELLTRREALCCLAVGLIRRCRNRIFLGLCELDEQGSEQKGPLLLAIQQILRHQVESEW